jgi:hypothetical protein
MMRRKRNEKKNANVTPTHLNANIAERSILLKRKMSAGN